MVGLGGRRGGTVPPDHFFGSSTTWSQSMRNSQLISDFRTLL